MTNRESGEAIFLDTEVMLQKGGETGLIAVAMAMDIIMVLWWPTKEPVLPDTERIVEHLNRFFPRRDYSVPLFEKNKADVEKFFTVLADGRWVPNPEIFSLVGDDERG